MIGDATLLTCRCGSCRIRPCDPEPRFRIECLCYDCRQRCLISATKHIDNGLPEAVVAYQRGVDLLYFANALVVDEASRALLEFSKLREDAFNTTATSSCCGTVMCGVNPAFQGAAIWVTPDSCQVTMQSQMTPRFYLFSCDFPPQKYAELPLLATIPTVVSASDELDGPHMVAI